MTEDLQPYEANHEGLDDMITDIVALRHKYEKDRDDEQAHEQELKIRHRVLLTIASGRLGRRGSQEFARAALQTSNIDFSRWTA